MESVNVVVAGYRMGRDWVHVHFSAAAPAGSGGPPPNGLGSSGGPIVGTSLFRPGLDEPAGFTLVRLAVLLVVVIAAARLLHASAATAWALVAVVTVWTLAASAFWLTPLAGAGMSWLLGTGFLTHRAGELSFTADDQHHLGVLVMAALVALLVRARARSAARSQSPEYRSLEYRRGAPDGC